MTELDPRFAAAHYQDGRDLVHSMHRIPSLHQEEADAADCQARAATPEQMQETTHSFLSVLKILAVWFAGSVACALIVDRLSK